LPERHWCFRDHHAHVLVGVAIGDRLPPPRRSRGADRELELLLASGIERQADVLVGQPQGEAGGELAGEHPPRLRHRIWRSQRSLVDRVDEELRVDPERLGQGNRLGDRLDLRGEPVVEDELQPAPVSGPPKPERLAADRVEYRLDSRADCV
jgi:hypothetical protein